MRRDGNRRGQSGEERIHERKEDKNKERMKMWGGDERWRDVEQRI